jgi:hypothetical protein
VRNSPGPANAKSMYADADRAQPLARTLGAGNGSAHLGGELAARVTRHLGQQRLAVGEVAIGGRARHPRRPGGLAQDDPIGSAVAGQRDARLDHRRVQGTVVVGLSALGAGADGTDARQNPTPTPKLTAVT